MFLIVTRNFPPDIGGIQILMEGLSKSLLDHGPVQVFADGFENSESYDLTSQMNIVRTKGIKLFKKYRKANLVNNFIRENSSIRAIFFDHWKSLELINRELLNKTKTFCLIHGKEINHSIGSLINKRIIASLDKSNFVIANSNFTKNLSLKIGINPSKVNIINPGVEKPKNIKKDFIIKAENIFGNSYPKIITVARLDKRKGHDKILMLIKNLKIKFPKIKYVSVGFGDEEKNLVKLKKTLDIENEVVFINNTSKDLKLALIKNSNLFLMPSRIEKKSVEGFGISFMEAASYGVASIGGKDGGASDAIRHDKTGLICDGNNLNSIYDAVLNFFENKNSIEYGKAASNFSENFYWDKIIKKYINLIN